MTCRFSSSAILSTTQSKATMASKSCLSSLPNLSLHCFIFSLMILPAARTRSSSRRFTFIGYSRSAIFIFTESSSINVPYLSAYVSNTFIDFADIFVHFPFQFRNTFVFRVYIIYNLSDFNLIFKISQLLIALTQIGTQFMVFEPYRTDFVFQRLLVVEQHHDLPF